VVRRGGAEKHKSPCISHSKRREQTSVVGCPPFFQETPACAVEKVETPKRGGSYRKWSDRALTKLGRASKHDDSASQTWRYINTTPKPWRWRGQAAARPPVWDGTRVGWDPAGPVWGDRRPPCGNGSLTQLYGSMGLNACRRCVGNSGLRNKRDSCARPASARAATGATRAPRIYSRGHRAVRGPRPYHIPNA
jgi:hypothetical protein